MTMKLASMLFIGGHAPSVSVARRMIVQGAVRRSGLYGDLYVTDPDAEAVPGKYAVGVNDKLVVHDVEVEPKKERVRRTASTTRYEVRFHGVAHNEPYDDGIRTRRVVLKADTMKKAQEVVHAIWRDFDVVTSIKTYRITETEIDPLRGLVGPARKAPKKAPQTAPKKAKKRKSP